MSNESFQCARPSFHGFCGPTMTLYKSMFFIRIYLCDGASRLCGRNEWRWLCHGEWPHCCESTTVLWQTREWWVASLLEGWRGTRTSWVCSSHNPIYITTEAVYRPGWSSKLTGVVEQVLVMSNLGHVSRRHGVRGENWPTQGRGPQVIGAQCLLLGFTMWRERPGLFCNHTNRVKPRPDLY